MPLLRRLTFDLTGLPLTVAEIENFKKLAATDAPPVRQSACGFGAVAFSALLGKNACGQSADYKPLLKKLNGRDPRKAMGKLEPTQFDNIGKVMQSLGPSNSTMNQGPG